MSRSRKLSRAFRRTMIILGIYAIGLAEAYYLPPWYGLEWMLGALALTAFVAGYWIRNHWD